MKTLGKIQVSEFSKHLFWDVDIQNLNMENNPEFIIKRVLEYGLLKDWKIIHDYYGIRKIAEYATQIRELDLKSANFIAVLSDIPKEKFACYTTKQSTPQHWNF